MIGFRLNSALMLAPGPSLSRSLAKGLRTTLTVGVVAFACLHTAWTQADAEEQAAKYAEAGQQALAAGRYPEARENFEQLAKLHPNLAEIHATLAAIYFQQREYELSLREVRTAKKLKPSLPRLDSLLGLSLSELGQFEEALPLLEKGFKQTADLEGRRMCGLQLLRAYSGLKRDPDAVRAALDLNKLYPDDPEVLYHTGRIYGNFAYIIMTKLHDKAPNTIWMLQAAAEASESTKNYDAAVSAFNHILELEPRRNGIHYRLGRIYQTRYTEGQKAEDREAAQREFNAELEIDPGNGNARYELAAIQADLGNIEDARKLYEEVLERYPDFEEALVGLGGVLLDSQKESEAVGPLERATRINPDDDVAWYRLGRAYRGAGRMQDRAKALAEYRRIHSSTPATLPNPNSDDTVTPQELPPGTQP
jgi:tetratricopeptide (TPR) repeat protein